MSKDIAPERSLLAHAKLSFSEPAVQWSIREMRKSPEILKELAKEFDKIITGMNEIQAKDLIDHDKYGAVARLKEQIDKPLPTLGQLTAMISSEKKPDILPAIEETFSEIGAGLPAGGDWNWATKEMPLVMGPGLLIEGYGRMLAKHYGNYEVKKNFVLGFEETGYLGFRKSRIMQSVVKWMKEENADFSPSVRRRLRKQITKEDKAFKMPAL